MIDPVTEQLTELRKVANQSLAGDHRNDCWKFHYKCAILNACDLAQSQKNQLEEALGIIKDLVGIQDSYIGYDKPAATAIQERIDVLALKQ